MRCAWLIYGAMNQPTGGYVYDRIVVEGLRAAGHVVDVIDLGPALGSVERALGELCRHAYDCIVGDELCHPELAVVFERLRGRRGPSQIPSLALLVHHLHASETGGMPESERQAITLADLVITTSHATARQVSHWAGVSSIVCLPGADRLTRIARAPRPEGMALQLLFVGTWTERKGLLRALQYLRQLREVEFRFDVVGDTSREPDYAVAVFGLLTGEPWLKERTHVHGVLAERELAAVYARSDVLLLPSSYEGYGMVLTEALNAGVAVMVSDVGATAEVVRHDVDGLLLPMDDGSVWVHNLRQLANEPARLDRWSGHTRHLSTWQATVADFERALLPTRDM